MKKKLFFFLIFISVSNIYSSSNLDYYFSNPVESSSSNYGITGVLELPNARFMKEASVSGISLDLFQMNILLSLQALLVGWKVLIDILR